MARTKETRANAAPGAGTIFALRAIGLVILARWLFSMSEMGLSLTTFLAMVSSPWACINLVFIFLVIFLPGAHARAERPFHPLPQWLRQSLRLFALLGFVFAIWSVGAFVWTAGWRRTINAIATTNGWLVAAPALYAAVLWICRPRALWRTNIAARRFAIGRYAVALDLATRTAIVWVESRKVGQYDARELSVRWPVGMQDGAGVGESDPTPPATDDPGPNAHVTNPAAVLTPRHPGLAGLRRRSLKIELLWDSPAAAGHNRQTVFRTPLVTDGDRVAARALDSMLRQA